MFLDSRARKESRGSRLWRRLSIALGLALTLGAVLATQTSKHALPSARAQAGALANPLLSLSPDGNRGPMQGRVTQRLPAGPCRAKTGRR